MSETADNRVPYAVDFTPVLLGRQVGRDRVLGWLLETVEHLASSAGVRQRIAEVCLNHITGEANQRDMASHVLQGLVNYGLVEAGDADVIRLSRVGQHLLECDPSARDLLFARHILTACNGYRLVEAVKRYELRGETPLLEDLAEQLDRHRTAKSISSMRAWLARAGIFSESGPYRVNAQALERILGGQTEQILGLTKPELDFLIAARLLQSQSPANELSAVEVADLAESRVPGLSIRRKSLSSFTKRLVVKGFLVPSSTAAGKGGARQTVKLSGQGLELTDEQLRGLFAQSQLAFPLSQLEPMSVAVAGLNSGSTDEQGRFGEMVAIHCCLMLGLTICGWRQRAPHAEIDLIAERLAGLAYQRWAIQVKNTQGDMDSDRIDRELGAVTGTGIKYVLFVVPRAGLTTSALSEIHHRNRISDYHIYYLDVIAVAELPTIEGLLRSLSNQAHDIMILKRQEADRRESR